MTSRLPHLPRHQNSSKPPSWLIWQPPALSRFERLGQFLNPVSYTLFAPPPDSLRPPVHEVCETIGEHAELKGADAAALLKESSPVVAIAYELARRGWLTIDHAHQIYLGLNFGKSVIDEELHRLIPEPKATTSNERLSEQDARSIIESLLPAELKPLWAKVFREARLAKYTEDTGSYVYLRPKNAPLANQPISDFALQVISLKNVEELSASPRKCIH